VARGRHLGDVTVADRAAADTIARRASSGVLLLAVRGVVIRALGFGTSIVLARLLTPGQFGLVALATSIAAFGDLLGSAGVGAALVQRAEEPSIDELRALVGFQSAITGVIAVATLIVGLATSRTVLLAAVMLCSLPIAAFRAPGAIVLQWSVTFGPVARVEVMEFLAYSAVAIVAVALGANVWGLAAAVVGRALAGTVLMIRAAPCGFVPPRWAWTRIRGLLGFGLRYQGVGAVTFVRDELINVGIAAVGGFRVLGLWDLASSLFEVPMFLYESLWRVTFPAMARLRDAGAELRGLIERTIGRVAIVAGLLVSALVGSAPAVVPAVFGARWREASYALPGACAGLLIAGPVSVAAIGYLFSAGEERTVLRSTMASAITLLAVTLPLVTVGRLWAIGAGFLAALLVQTWILARASTRGTGARMIAPMALPLCLAMAAAALAWGVSAQLPPTLPAAAGSLALAVCAYAVPLALLDRAAVRDLIRMVRLALRAVETRA
jgi:O-antigen/teichoic acid export membrane protein